jgi:flagellar motility protein MotE (MotC chaperone)
MYILNNLQKQVYQQHLWRYQGQNCEDCSLQGQCFKAKENRTLEQNQNLERHKEKIRVLTQAKKECKKNTHSRFRTHGLLFKNIT